MDPLSIARYGMMSAQDKLAKSAQLVASWSSGDGDVDLVQETVALAQAKTEFAANAQVVRFADDMWRALLDVQAR